MTRHTHYAALPPATNGRGGRHWTYESILQALALYVQEEGHYPTSTHLHAREGLPTYVTIREVFGTLPAALHALTAVVTPPTRTHAGTKPCPRCGKPYTSPDLRKFRMHPQCRTLSASQQDEDGLWMNNTPILANGACEWFDTEEL